MKKIVHQINTILEQKTQLSPNKRVLCTLSGGQDSIMLFLVLLYLKQQWNLQIQLIYCQHFWQAKNFISLWQIWKIAFIFQTPICFVISEKNLGSENQARHWRKKSIERVALIQNCLQIGFGHTGTDKLETALWHLIRGASPTSLNSVTLKKTIPYPHRASLFSISEFKSKYLKDEPLLIQKHCKVVDDSFQANTLTIKNSVNHKKVFLKSNTLSIQSDQKFFKFNSTSSGSRQVGKKKRVILQKEQTKTSRLKKNYFFKTSKNLILRTGKKFPNSTRIFPVTKFQNHQSLSFWLENYVGKKELLILRPLLYLHREDILALTEYFLIPVIPDKTNNFGKLARSKIRNQLIPSIRFLFNSNFDSLFIQFLNILEFQEKDSKNIIKKITQNYLQFYKIESKKSTSVKKQNLGLLKAYLQKSVMTLPVKSKTNQSTQVKPVYLVMIQKSFQKMPISNQLRLLKTLFLNYNSTQLTYTQVETLRFLILSTPH